MADAKEVGGGAGDDPDGEATIEPAGLDVAPGDIGATTGVWHLASSVPSASNATVPARTIAKNPTIRRREMVSLLIDHRV